MKSSTVEMIGALLCAALLCSCAAGKPVLSASIPVPVSINALAMAVTQRDMSISTLKADLKVKITSTEKGSSSTQAALVLSRPGNMRVEILGPFWEIEGVLVVNGARYMSLYMKDRVARTGVLGPGAIEREWGIPLEPLELEALLIGSIPAIQYTQGQTGVDEKTGELVLLIEKPGGPGQELRINGRNLAITKARMYDSAGKTIYTVEYSGHLRHGSLMFPSKARADFGDGRILEVKFKNVEINADVRDVDFGTEAPQGFSENQP